MKEPNLGINTVCVVCGESFWCEDGYPVCSGACDNQLECPHCGDQKDPEEDHCEECAECPSCGQEKEPYEDYCGGDICEEEEEEEK